MKKQENIDLPKFKIFDGKHFTTEGIYFDEELGQVSCDKENASIIISTKMTDTETGERIYLGDVFECINSDGLSTIYAVEDFNSLLNVRNLKTNEVLTGQNTFIHGIRKIIGNYLLTPNIVKEIMSNYKLHT